MLIPVCASIDVVSRTVRERQKEKPLEAQSSSSERSESKVSTSELRGQVGRGQELAPS